MLKKRKQHKTERVFRSSQHLLINKKNVLSFMYNGNLCFQNWNLFLSTRNYKTWPNSQQVLHDGVQNVHTCRECIHPDLQHYFSELVGMRHSAVYKTRPALPLCTQLTFMHCSQPRALLLASYHIHCSDGTSSHGFHGPRCTELVTRGSTHRVRAAGEYRQRHATATFSFKYKFPIGVHGTAINMMRVLILGP